MESALKSHRQESLEAWIVTNRIYLKRPSIRVKNETHIDTVVGSQGRRSRCECARGVQTKYIETLFRT